ncbi:MAG: phosphate acyltransferase [Candidatus Midichloriaceae bacterium]|jgi:glycerol-3-phosphate acyltransferase PlsX|nr:phosphate acyltransferase [Candidatus Midichloriaceae bacterium]
MGKSIVISVDVMGGANAPLSVISGLELFCKENNSTSFLLYGRETEIRQLVEKTKHLKNFCKIIDCETVVSDDEQPVKAAKTGINSSMRKAIEAVKSGAANACVSSGNTGALMVMSKMVLGMLSGIKRPAIVSIFPNRTHGTVMLDLGANAECDPQHLMQFAIMGVCFAKVILKKENPSIGILNVGVEEYKGRELDKKLSQMLATSGLNYHGFVEGHDLSEGTVDVAVTDGFTGNIALKVAEGVAKTCMHYMKTGFKSSLISKLGALLAARGLKKSFSIIDPRHYNGAMFIGVDGIVVKSHGSSDEIAFANALSVAEKLAKDKINKNINSTIEQHTTSTASSIVSKIKHSLGLE